MTIQPCAVPKPGWSPPTILISTSAGPVSFSPVAEALLLRRQKIQQSKSLRKVHCPIATNRARPGIPVVLAFGQKAGGQRAQSPPVSGRATPPLPASPQPPTQKTTGPRHVLQEWEQFSTPPK